LEALNVPNIGSDYQSFCGTRFADFLLGKTTYKNNNCDDIEYEYTIHMNCSVILGRHVLDENNHTYRLTFDQLKSHFRFEHITPTV
jgi:hypothetical protein